MDKIYLMPIELQIKFCIILILTAIGFFAMGWLYGLRKANQSWHQVFEKHSKTVGVFTPEMEQQREMENRTSCDSHDSHIQSAQRGSCVGNRRNGDTLH